MENIFKRLKHYPSSKKTKEEKLETLYHLRQRDDARILIHPKEYRDLQKDYSSGVLGESRKFIPFTITKRDRYGNMVQKIGVLDITGTIIKKPIYDFAIGDYNNLFILGEYQVHNNQLQYLYTAYSSITGKISRHFKHLILSDDNNMVIMDGSEVFGINGNINLGFRYDLVSDIVKGYIRVKIGKESSIQENNNNRWGLLDKDGYVVFKAEYKSLYFSNDYTGICVDGKYIPFEELNVLTRFHHDGRRAFSPSDKHSGLQGYDNDNNLKERLKDYGTGFDNYVDEHWNID